MACVLVSPVNAANLNFSKFKSLPKSNSALSSFAIELSKSKELSAAEDIWSKVIPKRLASNAAAAKAPGAWPTLNLVVAEAFDTSSKTSFKLRDKPFDWFNPATTPPISAATSSKLLPESTDVLNNPWAASSLKPKKWVNSL